MAFQIAGSPASVSNASVSQAVQNKKSLWALFPIATAFLGISLMFGTPAAHGLQATGQIASESTPQPGL